MEPKYQPQLGVSASIFEEFDGYLENRKLRFEGVIIGSTPLILKRIITRMTKDCDVLEPRIPEDIMNAAVEFSLLKQTQGSPLDKNWFNNGPESMRDYLPEGWRDHTELVFAGKALILHTLDRQTMLKTKLLAYCDREVDLKDCIAMRPTIKELDDAIDWVKNHDGNPMWPAYVEDRFRRLEKELGISREQERSRGGFEM